MKKKRLARGWIAILLTRQRTSWSDPRLCNVRHKGSVKRASYRAPDRDFLVTIDKYFLEFVTFTTIEGALVLINMAVTWMIIVKQYDVGSTTRKYL